MKTTLSRDHRKILETTVAQARVATDAQKKLRVRMAGRALGDLLHPDSYPASLADCKEDAETFDPPARSEWEVAGHYASAMLGAL